MSVTITDPTLGTVFGTPVLFFPVPTPWPSSAGCDEYIYRQIGEGTLLAWDPVYTRLAPGSDSERCLLPQQRLWWDQETSANPSTALGPTFVCPEAYGAVHSTVLDSNSAAQTQYTYCCPPKFELAAILPQNQRSVIQCTSTAGPGATLSYVSVTFVTSTVTITGEDGTVTRQANTELANLPTSTIVQSSAATVYAPPVNGYNFVTGQAAGVDATERTPPPGETGDVSTQPSAQLVAPGTIAGAVVGAVLGLGLLALGAFFVRQRYRHSVAESKRPSLATWSWEGEAGHYHDHGLPQGLGMSEMPAESMVQELPNGRYAHELPGGPG